MHKLPPNKGKLLTETLIADCFGVGSKFTSLASSQENSAQFLEYCLRERLQQQLFAKVNSGKIELSTKTQSKLEKKARSISAHAMKLAAETIQISESFSEANIQHLNLKGIALSTQIYSNETQRTSGDIDLLVESQSVPRALKVLESEGYRLKRKLSEKQFAHTLKTQHALEFIKENSAEVDLHWRLSQKQFALGELDSAIWNTKAEVIISGKSLPTTTIEHSVLILCIQGSKEFWQPLSILYDIYCASLDEEFSWEVFKQLKSYQGNKTLVQTALCLAYLSFQTELPATEVSEKSKGLARKLRSKAISEISSLESAQLQLSMRSLPAKIRYVLGRLFIPHESDWDLELPDSLFPLHYILKPLKTIFRGTLSLIS